MQNEKNQGEKSKYSPTDGYLRGISIYLEAEEISGDLELLRGIYTILARTYDKKKGRKAL